MEIVRDVNLESYYREIEWAGAKDVLNQIIEYDEEHDSSVWDEAENYIEEFASSFEVVPTETMINDYIWFELADDLKEYGNIDIWE